MKTATTLDPPDFSLVMGGPLFQLFHRAYLSGDALELLRRRVVVIVLLTWLPPLLLSVIEGGVSGGSIKVPFLYDIEAHVRFLVALPALFIAELTVHKRVGPLIRRFVERRIIAPEDLPALNSAVKSTVRVRNSIVTEVVLLILVYTLGLALWRNQIAMGTATWYAHPDQTGFHITHAGYWYAFVSIPIFQFILLRWYMRIFLWFHLLWRISRLNLRLTGAHPDRAGGIGFLGTSSYAFGPILFAQGALLSGLIASRVLYEGQNLLSFKVDAGCLVAAMVLLILGPLTMFTPQMERTRRKSSAEYGLLANRYVAGFEEKWMRGGEPEMGDLLGSGDIQSLADLGNSYATVCEMRIVPFGMKDVTRLAAVTAAPLIPLTLTIFSLEEVLTRLLKILL